MKLILEQQQYRDWLEKDIKEKLEERLRTELYSKVSDRDGEELLRPRYNNVRLRDDLEFLKESLKDVTKLHEERRELSEMDCVKLESWL